MQAGAGNRATGIAPLLTQLLASAMMVAKSKDHDMEEMTMKTQNTIALPSNAQDVEQLIIEQSDGDIVVRVWFEIIDSLYI